MKQLKTIILLSIICTSAQNSYIAAQVVALPVFDGDGTDLLWNNVTWQNINQVWMPYNFPEQFLYQNPNKKG
jgi:hypothetical protein